jgi:hypothetical protein
MATQPPIILTDNYQAITQVAAYLDISDRAEVEYYTGASSTPTGGTIKAIGGFGHPGCTVGDSLYMKINTALYGLNIAVIVDEVA